MGTAPSASWGWEREAAGERGLEVSVEDTECRPAGEGRQHQHPTGRAVLWGSGSGQKATEVEQTESREGHVMVREEEGQRVDGDW